MAGGGKVNITTPKLNGIQVQTSLYGTGIPKGWGTFRVSGNLIWYGDFRAIAQTESSSGGKGGGGRVSNTTYTYKASLAMALTSGPIAGVRKVFRDQSVLLGLGGTGLSLMTGELGQAPWGFLTTRYPAEALGYSGLAYVYAQGYQLSDSAVLQNHSFEVQSTVRVVGLDDANPAEIIPDFLSMVPFWQNGLVANLTDYSNFCMASDYLISPVIEGQIQGAAFLREVLMSTNSDCVWSDGTLKVRPLGDGVVTANGVTWTPDLTPIYDLTEDDFLREGEEDPVEYDYKRTADSYNYVQIKYRDREHQYNEQIVPGIDQANIDEYGQRKKDPVTLSGICRTSMATSIAQVMVQHSANVHRKYRFRLPWNFCLLEPLDLVTITVPRLELDHALVRIEEITEDEDGELDFLVEEVLIGTSQPALISRQEPEGYESDFLVNPGDVTTPMFISPPRQMTGGALEIWAAVSGGEFWGGAEVWVSVDDVSYVRQMTWRSPGRYGATTSSLVLAEDPQVAGVVGVDIGASGGELASVSQADVNDLSSLCIIDAEVIAYRDATLTAEGEYDLSYLRRGLLGTAPASHTVGALFARLDDAILRLPYRSDQIGRTLYVKFRSFNIFGQAVQDLADVDAYQVTLSPTFVLPPAPANIVVTAGAETGGDGSSIPTIEVSATASNPVASGLVVRYRPDLGDLKYHPPVSYEAGVVEFTISGVQSQTDYQVEAAEIVDGVLSSFVPIDEVLTGGVVSGETVPVVPGNVSGTPTLSIASSLGSDGTVRVLAAGDWNDATNAIAYVVELDDGVAVRTVEFAESKFSEIAAIVGRTYRYRAKGKSGTGHLSAAWSSWSASVEAGGDDTAPAEPTAGSAVARGLRNLVAWTPATAPDYRGLILWRTTTSTPPTLASTPYAPIVQGSNFIDDAVTPGQRYWYWGASVDYSGNPSAITAIGNCTARFVNVGGGDVDPRDEDLITSLGRSRDLNPTSRTHIDALAQQLEESSQRALLDLQTEKQAKQRVDTTRAQMDVFVQVDPVVGRGRFRGNLIDIDGSALTLEDVTTRTEAGLDEFGNVSRNIPTTVLNGSNILRRTGGGVFTGDLTATEGANWTSNVSGRPTELTDGRIGTALNASGVLQTAIPSALADTSNILRRTGGGLFSGDLNANRITNTNELTDGANLGGTANWGSVTSRPVELTDGRVAAGLAANGDLARAIPSALADTSNLLRRTGGGVFTGDLTATAGANWGTNVSGRPVELTDGRIGTALNASGVLQTAIPSTLADTSNLLRRTAGGLYTGALDANRITNTNELTDGANLGGTANWGSVSSRPANLASLSGSEGILNTAITLSAAGVLSGAGTSVQVNLASLPGTVGTSQVADGAISGTKLANNAVDLASAKVTGKSLTNVDSAAATKLAGIQAGAQVNPANLAALDPTAASDLSSAKAATDSLGALATKSTVATADIDNNSVVYIEPFEFSGSVTTSGATSDATAVTVMSFTVTSAGEPLLIETEVMARFWHPATGDFSFTLRFNRLGFGPVRNDLVINGINGDQFHGFLSPRFVDQPGAGTHTYQVLAWASTNTGFTHRDLSDRVATVTHLKTSTLP